jgi:hypothetical protein
MDNYENHDFVSAKKHATETDEINKEIKRVLSVK